MDPRLEENIYTYIYIDIYIYTYVAEEAWDPCGGVQGGRGMSCCYLHETWAVGRTFGTPHCVSRINLQLVSLTGRALAATPMFSLGDSRCNIARSRFSVGNIRQLLPSSRAKTFLPLDPRHAEHDIGAHQQLLAVQHLAPGVAQ